MMVYIMAAEGIHKVGMSSDPKRRRKGVISPNGESVSLVRTWKISGGRAYDAERMAHRLLDAHRIDGTREWFTCSYAEIERVVRQAVKHVNAGGHVPRARPKGLRPLRPRERRRVDLVALQAEYISTLAEKYAHVR